MNEHITQARVVTGNDAMSLMIDVWLLGYSSGAHAGAISVLANQEMNPGPEHAQRFGCAVAHKLHDKVLEDPLMIETIREHITDRLKAQTSGVTTGELRVHVDEPADGGDGS